MSAPALTVRTITPDQHLAHLREQRSASFLQTPAWGEVKNDWRSESVGWFDGNELVGSALVLYRQLPKVKRYLAYLPEGPVIDWSTEDLGAWLAPLTRHLKRAGAFGVRMGPPVVVARWTAAALKEGIADEAVDRLAEVPPTERSQEGARVVSQLQELGWRLQGAEGGFAAGQPRFNFQIPLRQVEGRTAGEPRTEEDVLAGMNQQWRRNIKKAAKAGVEVTHGTPRGPPAVPRALRPHRRARPLHAAAAVLLRDHVPRAARRGARPDPALPRPARGRPRRGDDLDPGRRAHLVLLRRLLHREARRARLQRRSSGG